MLRDGLANMMGASDLNILECLIPSCRRTIGFKDEAHPPLDSYAADAARFCTADGTLTPSPAASALRSSQCIPHRCPGREQGARSGATICTCKRIPHPCGW